MEVDKLVAKYIELRDKKAQLEADQKEKLAPINKLLSRIEGTLLGQFDELGTTAMKTPFGTAYTSTRTSATIADREAFLHGFVVPNGAWEYLTNHVNKSAVEEFKAQNDELPPGINYSESRTINIRKG